MKALVVGTGSVGNRHIENLRRLGVEVAAFSYRDLSHRSSLGEAPTEALAKAIDRGADLVVVANRTDQHVEAALLGARRKRSLFIEKPLSNSLLGVEDLLAMERDSCLIVEAGFTLRCHPNVVWMREFLASGALGEVMHVRASVGQWLPDWRPGSDYREGYAARRSTGGGVILDLVHEIDLVHWLFGPIALVSCMRRFVPLLEIETEAIAQLTLRCTSGVIAQVNLDYVRRDYARSFEVVGSRGTLIWDYPTSTIRLSRLSASAEVVHSAHGFERNDMFLEHMSRFVARARGSGIPASSSLADSAAVLRAALAGHLSDSERRHVTPSEVTEAYVPT